MELLRHVAVFGILLGVAPAWAAPRGKPAAPPRAQVLVVPLPAPDVPPNIQDQILAGLARQLREQYGLGAISGRAVGRAIFATRGSGLEQSLRQLQRLVKDGKQAYEMLQIQKALKLFAEARELAELAGAELDGPQPLIDLHLYSGLSLLATGKTPQAAAEFRQAVAMDPELKLSSKKFPPDVLAAFERAKRELLSGRPAEVQFVSRPPGASLFLDGKERGRTPIRSLGVYPGGHFIRLTLAGHAPWTLNLPDGVAPSAVKALMMPEWSGQSPEDLIATAISTEAPSESMLELLRELGLFYRADALLLTSLSREAEAVHLGLRLFVAEPESAPPARLFNLGSRPEAFDKKLKGIASTLKALRGVRPGAPRAGGTGPALASPAPADPFQPPPSVVRKPTPDPGVRVIAIPAPQPPIPEPEDTSTPWYKSWWFWTLTGVVVAGATVGALWGAGVFDSGGSWTLVVQPRQ